MSTDPTRLHQAKLANNCALEFSVLREALKRVNERGRAEAPLVLAEMIAERADRLTLIRSEGAGNA